LINYKDSYSESEVLFEKRNRPWIDDDEKNFESTWYDDFQSDSDDSDRGETYKIQHSDSEDSLNEFINDKSESEASISKESEASFTESESDDEDKIEQINF